MRGEYRTSAAHCEASLSTRLWNLSLCARSHSDCDGEPHVQSRYCGERRVCDKLVDGVRGHWGVESMHWLLDVEFKDDLSRYRTGDGAKNMAIVRRFALSPVCADKRKGSVKKQKENAPVGTQTISSNCCSSNER
jgi:hypothetical protein